jgi:hypothetical protein
VLTVPVSLETNSIAVLISSGTFLKNVIFISLKTSSPFKIVTNPQISSILRYNAFFICAATFPARFSILQSLNYKATPLETPETKFSLEKSGHWATLYILS